ncbi:MAG: metal-dependent hydrolase [Deltaproteobacteria bacterium]|nr:metal-dependent hydrolase [Deltaproteobacteria bacterium]
MFAINHAATALIIKKVFKDVPIIWLLISVQFMELLWVSLNFLGIEKTTTDEEVKYVGNIHLSYMPFSHSIVTMSGVGIAAWLVIAKLFGLPEVGLAVGLGILSHLVLDLITHSQDIALAPFINQPKFGLGLYFKKPIPAFFLEIAYGVVCWWIYEGSFTLLIMIILFNLANLSMFFKAIPGLEQKMAHRPLLITTVVLIQIIVTLIMVDLLS